MRTSIFSEKERYEILDAINRGADWLVSRQGVDGSIELEKNVTAKDPFCYYKVIWPLVLAGKFREADLLSSYIKSTFMLKDGDFSGGEPRSEDEWFQWRYYTYLNLWIIIGAHKLGRFDISIPGIRYMLKYRDPETGGFCNEKPYPEGKYMEDILTAAYNALGCLYMGRIDEACRAGDFLINVLSVQPDRQDRFYVAYNASDGLITDVPFKEKVNRIVETSERDQFYYYIGFPVISLSKLYLATSEEKYLEAANGYFDFTKSCQEDVYASPPSGKLGWGAAILYRITGDRDVGEAVRRQVRYLLKTQDREGCWSRFPGFKMYMNGEPYPITGRLDATGEFTSWLCEILQVS
jgi:hypothetical protein